MSSSPWVIVSASDPLGVQDLLEKELIIEETEIEPKKIVKNEIEECSARQEIVLDCENDLASDALIAKLLQQHYDEESNAQKHRKNSLSKTVNIPILFAGFNERDSLDTELEKEEETEDFCDHKDWDQSDTAKKEIYKHDIFCNEGRTELANSKSEEVNHRLKLHSKQYETVAEFGLDQYNRLQLCKMIKNQTLKRVNHVIGIGKEAVVLHAEHNSAHSSTECVLKLFTLTETEFKKRTKYTVGDKRFSKDIFYKRNVNLWAEKEMLNLLRLKKAGILSPEVIGLKHNILIMSFIGDNGVGALPLKFTNLEVDEYILAYSQVVEAMKSLYSGAGLVHADLSECNILWHNKQCYFIDLSQAVKPISIKVFKFLFMDCTNITKFFVSKGLPDIMTPEELFIEITGCDFNNRIELNTLAETLANGTSTVNG